MNLDDPKLKTIPIIIGEKKSKFLSILLLILSSIIYLKLFDQGNVSNNIIVGIIITLFITSFLILRSNNKKSEIYFSFWIESTCIIFYLILMLSSWIL